MISICIPIYNFDVTELVDELLKQANHLNYPVEVLLFDDHSQSFFRQRNSLLASRSNVNYLDFDFNIGRSKIRNRLADIATGQWLLFLDCDMIIDNAEYLKLYIDSLAKAKVICGGIKYGPKPFRNELLLRWKYGISRECKTAFFRQINPYSSFVSGNFIIDYETFHKVRFNEDLSGYGHEDTLLGLDLKKLQADILHIDNPTVHLGLDPNYEFLIKTEQAVLNLAHILNIMPSNRREIEKSIKLLSVFRFLRHIGMLYPLRWVFKLLTPVIKSRLSNNNPPIFLLDIYKLSLLAKVYTHKWKRVES